MSPEAFDKRLGAVAEPADVWAWACIMVEMLTGQVPWLDRTTGEHLDKNQIMMELVVHKHNPLSEAAGNLPEQLPPKLHAVLAKCFTHEPDGRPTLAEVAPGRARLGSARPPKSPVRAGPAGPAAS
jgi:serine/threonine protein kinase